MLVIIEGPDGVGKSTLSDAIIYHTNIVGVSEFRQLKAGPPRSHPLDEYVLPLIDYHPRASRMWRQNVVCDRWHLGEQVYPTVLDRPTQLTLPAQVYIEMFLASRGALVVYPVDRPKTLAPVLAARGDDLVRPEQADLLIKLFTEAVYHSALPVDRVPARDTSIAVVSSIVEHAIVEEHAAARLRDFVTYVGPPEPRYLLVGDVRGGNLPSHDRRPAFMPYANGCGEYLLRSILSVVPPSEHYGRRLEDVGIVNANDVDNLQQVWQTLRRPHVVALGRNAEKAVRYWLPAADVTYAPHPQWWKRFRYRDHEEYGKMITGSWT